MLEHQRFWNRLCLKLSEKVFVIKKVKNTEPWAFVIRDLEGEEIFGTFYKKRIAKNKSKRV